MTDCPCRGCEDRKFLCHSSCERYKQWKTEYETITQGLKAEKEYTGNDVNRRRYWEFLRRGR